MSEHMNVERPYALLDADFIIKATIAQKDEDNHLLDWLLSNSQYQFVCHEMTMQEVSKHDNVGAVPWIEKANEGGKVKLFTDSDIITKLHGFMGTAGIQTYKSFLKISCDSMSSTFYKEFYSSIEVFNPNDGVENFTSIALPN